MKTIKNKFLKYTRFDTQSNPESKTSPSTVRQFELAKELASELEALELKKITLTDKCYLYATLPANTDQKLPTVGFIAHMDTAPETPGNGVNPQIIENYDGKDIILNEKEKIILSPKEFPELLNYKGQDLITTDGTTLLGSDDKAGIAAIMTAIQYLVENPDIKHGNIKIAFTPDEEIGRGTDHFDVTAFGADFAFTIDGGEIGELEYENFNAANLEVKIKGRNVHPGTAKNKMINALNLAHNFHALLPEKARPEHTENYEGFFHLTKITGNVNEALMSYIIRNHDRQKFEDMKSLIVKTAKTLNEKYDKPLFTVQIEDSYYNMKEKIAPVMHIIKIAEKAMKEANITPKIKPIRGGTDGAKLSYMGLPCPNIFAGGHNFHGIYEYIPIASMQKASEVIVNIIKNIHAQ